MKKGEISEVGEERGEERELSYAVKRRKNCHLLLSGWREKKKKKT